MLSTLHNAQRVPCKSTVSTFDLHCAKSVEATKQMYYGCVCTVEVKKISNRFNHQNDVHHSVYMIFTISVLSQYNYACAHVQKAKKTGDQSQTATGKLVPEKMVLGPKFSPTISALRTGLFGKIGRPMILLAILPVVEQHVHVLRALHLSQTFLV